MKKFLTICAILFSGILSYGQNQNDVPIPTTSNNIVQVGRGLTWSAQGTFGGINNNFIITPKTVNLPGCLYIQNNDSVPHTMQVQEYAAYDPSVTLFKNNLSKWVPLQFIFNGHALTISANSLASVPLYATSASRVTFNMSGDTTQTTAGADVFFIQGSSNCSGALSSLGITQTLSGTIPIVAYQDGLGAMVGCSGTTSITVTSGAAASAIVGPITSPQSFYVCGISMQVNATITTLGSVRFLQSSAANCSVPSTLWEMWPTQTAVGGAPYVYSGTTGFLFNISKGNYLCVINNSVGGSVVLNFTDAQF